LLHSPSRRPAAARARWALAVAAVAGLAAVIPGATATAQPVTPIQHVVVIYLENHSFDNLLGYWCDDNPGRCPDGGMPAQVTLSNGATVTPSVDPDTVPPVDHSVTSQLAAMHIVNGVPQMNGWQKILSGGCKAPQYNCISGYTPSQIPNITSLAGQFAISDMTFSMADSPSWGGHVYAVASTLDGFQGNNPKPASGVPPGPGWGCDSSLVTQWQAPGNSKIVWAPSCIPDYSLNPVQYPNGGAFEPSPASYVPTILDRLDASGLSWRIYGAANPADGGYIWSVCPSFAECLDTGQHGNLVDATQFTADAAAGNLPAFSLVTAGGQGNLLLDSCHNMESMTACDNYVGSLVGAVMNGPQWATTAVFLTWDDCGCFYDQARPPLAPDTTQEGPRVPLIIVSPFAKPGFTDTTPATFASILAYTEQTFGLAPLGPNDADAYDFSNAFDYTQAPLGRATMVHRPLPWTARHIHLTPALLGDPS